MQRAFNLLRRVFFKPSRYWYAAQHKRHRGWLVDWRARGVATSLEFGASVWFDEPDEAALALVTSQQKLDDWQLVRLAIRPDSNHYKMESRPWH